MERPLQSNAKKCISRVSNPHYAPASSSVLPPISGISKTAFKYDYQISYKLFQPKENCTLGRTTWNSWYSTIFDLRKSTYMWFNTREGTFKEAWEEKKHMSKGVRCPGLCCMSTTPTPDTTHPLQTAAIPTYRVAFLEKPGKGRDFVSRSEWGTPRAWPPGQRGNVWPGVPTPTCEVTRTPGLSPHLRGARQGTSVGVQGEDRWPSLPAP